MSADILSLADPKLFRRGFDHVRGNDETLGRILERHGIITFEAGGELFDSLVVSILSQQIAGAAARAIIGRVRSIYPAGNLDPAAVSATSIEKLRAAGVSPQKISYLHDLSARAADGRINLEGLRLRSDEGIIKTLDEVRGIGPWTVHMLLIFTLGRPDVLPVDDLGIRYGVERIYKLSQRPKKAEIERIAESWHPFSTVASLYIWRHNDNPPQAPTTSAP